MKRALLIVTVIAVAVFFTASLGSAAAKSSAKSNVKLNPKPALKADRDRDGMADRWERRNKLSVRRDDSQRDPDEDGLNNLEEYNGDTDPRNDDTDGNGVLDGDEDGVVVSYNASTGLLRVAMPGGHRIKGLVDEDTMVFCEPDDPSAGLDDGPDGLPPVDVTEVDPNPDYSLFDDECGAENILPGAAVVYVDIDHGYFTDVTLNEYPAAGDGA